jgi:hypothetical protein
VTEKEFSPRAGQRLGKIALSGLARYVLNYNLVIGPRTGRESFLKFLFTGNPRW